VSNPQLGNFLQNMKDKVQEKLNPPPPDPRAEIERKRVELTMAKNDLQKKQSEFDKLVPDEVTERKTNEAKDKLNEYKNTQVHQYEIELKLYDSVLAQLKGSFGNPAQEIARRYKEDLNKKGQHISHRYQQNREQAYADRRRFIDADPQEGISGIGWFSSVDQQVLLVFWVSYSLFIGAAIAVYLINYGGNTKNIAIIMTIVFIVAILIAHYALKLFATD